MEADTVSYIFAHTVFTVTDTVYYIADTVSSVADTVSSVADWSTATDMVSLKNGGYSILQLLIQSTVSDTVSYSR